MKNNPFYTYFIIPCTPSFISEVEQDQSHFSFSKLQEKEIGEKIFGRGFQTFHPGRLREKWACRYALLQLLPIGDQYSLTPAELLENVKDEFYHRLKEWPTYLLSLTHSKLLTAATLSNNKELSSIGIDIEELNRALQIEMYHHFKNSSDKIEKSSNKQRELLQLWVAKEAAFKAVDSWKNFHLQHKFKGDQLSFATWTTRWFGNFFKNRSDLYLKDIWIKDCFNGQSIPSTLFFGVNSSFGEEEKVEDKVVGIVEQKIISFGSKQHLLAIALLRNSIPR